MAPMRPGSLITIASGRLQVAIAPQAGGRVAQIHYDGIDHLVGHDEANQAMIAWGSYPMLPWAGRIRHGRFGFQGQQYQLPLNLGAHAIHGVAFAMPWQVEVHETHAAALSLALPEDERWPFGGTAHQRIEVGEGWLKMRLSVSAGPVPMPVVIGWHPWFRKPEQLLFSPSSMYPRDHQGIATRPLVEPLPGPWDDCFVNQAPVVLQRAGQRLQLSSDCTNWVIYDQTASATCVEPQSGPPDAFNLEPTIILPGETLRKRFLIQWLKP